MNPECNGIRIMMIRPIAKLLDFPNVLFFEINIFTMEEGVGSSLKTYEVIFD